MRKLRHALLVGAGVTLMAGAAVAAEKTIEQSHIMKVALPDGTIAQIHYRGDVAPRVVVADAPVQRIAFVDPFAAAFNDPAFAQMDRISAMMAAQQQAMMQRVAQMRAQMADAMRQAAAQTQTVAAKSGGAEPGQAGNVVRYSFVSTTTGNGTCTQTVRWTSDGTDAQPKMIKTSAGDCAKGEAMEPAAPRKTSAPKAEQAIPGAHKV